MNWALASEWWNTILAFLVAVWAMWEVKALVAQILLNVVVAVAVGIYIRDFQLGKLGEFLYRKVLPYILVWVVAKAVATAAGMNGLAVAVWGILELTLLGDLTDNLGKLGIPIPDFLRKSDGYLVEMTEAEGSGQGE